MSHFLVFCMFIGYKSKPHFRKVVTWYTRNRDVIVGTIRVLKPLYGDDGVEGERVWNVCANLVLDATVAVLSSNASAVPENGTS